MNRKIIGGLPFGIAMVLAGTAFVFFKPNLETHVPSNIFNPDPLTEGEGDDLLEPAPASDQLV